MKNILDNYKMSDEEVEAAFRSARKYMALGKKILDNHGGNGGVASDSDATQEEEELEDACGCEDGECAHFVGEE